MPTPHARNATLRRLLPFGKGRDVAPVKPRQPRIPKNATPSYLLSNDPADVSGLVLSELDDPTLPIERRVAFVEELLRQGAGDRIPPAALVEWYVAAARALKAIDGSTGAPAAEPLVVRTIQWTVAHFAARAGLAADCQHAIEVALGAPIGAAPVPPEYVAAMARWQATQAAVLDLLVRALEPNGNEAEMTRTFLRDQLARQSRPNRTAVPRPTTGFHHA